MLAKFLLAWTWLVLLHCFVQALCTRRHVRGFSAGHEIGRGRSWWFGCRGGPEGTEGWPVRSGDEADAATQFFDFMINTIAANHDIAPYINMLIYNGKQILVALPPDPLSVHAFQLAVSRKMIAGSLIGGIKKPRRCWTFVPSMASAALMS